MGFRQRLSGLFRRTPKAHVSRPTGVRPQGEEIAVIGLGSFGQAVAVRLSQLGFTVLGIDNDAAMVQAVADDLTTALVLDSTNEDGLRQADIESYKTVIVAIGGDHFEATALTTITLAKIGVPQIVALANSPRQVEILEAIGATRVLSPVRDSALALADELADPRQGETWSLTSSQHLTLIPVPTSMIGQSAASLEQMGIAVLAVRRGEQVIRLPDSSFVLGGEDTLLALGDPPALLDLRRLA